MTAGKLSRKRPRLLPVYDAVVRAAVGAPRAFWSWLHRELHDDPGLVEGTERLRAEAGAHELTVLRTLDVVIWMRNYGFRFAASEALRSVEPIYVSR